MYYIARNAILNHATSIIVAHNHPSGDCSPSTADIEMTSLLKNAVYKNNESKTPFNETQKINNNEQLKNEFENGFKKDCGKYNNLRIIIDLGKKIKIIIN